jgi:hypothetical protein
LRRKERWDDSQYLARIIFCAMLQGDTDTATGFGISATLGDNEHHIIEVDCDKKVLRFTDENRRKTFRTFPFQAYCDMGSNELAKALREMEY